MKKLFLLLCIISFSASQSMQKQKTNDAATQNQDTRVTTCLTNLICEACKERYTIPVDPQNVPAFTTCPNPYCKHINGFNQGTSNTRHPWTDYRHIWAKGK